MKQKINEELDYIKYLFTYQQGKVISEQVLTETTTTKPVDDDIILDKNSKEEDFQKEIDKYTHEICSSNPTLCDYCIEMIRKLKFGKLQKNDAEACLNCSNKNGSEKLKCENLKTDLIINSNQVSTQKQSNKKGLGDKTSIWVLLGTSILNLFKEIKDMISPKQN
ncbi:hypothetical protein EBU91_03335 [bacterium]|nr:hypothetical protein [bacterium]